MTLQEIGQQRMQNQRIAVPADCTPGKLVDDMAAIQAQEYAMAKWAVGLRLHKSSDAEIEDAFNKGNILRTHVMRPTWHFVSPQNIRWLLELTAPRVHKANAFMYKKCEIDGNLFSKTNTVLEKTLSGGNFLTREKLKTALENVGITGDGVRMAYLLMNAELECLICSGPRQGNQFTYALMDERVPPTRVLSKEEALSKLAALYFGSRGPAQITDFAMWSGLTLGEVRLAVDYLPADFIQETFQDKTYVFRPTTTRLPKNPQSTFLMPDYDEFGMSYKDRSALSFEKVHLIPEKTKQFIFNRMIVVNGTLAGSWQRTVKGNVVQIEADLFVKLTEKEKSDVIRSAEKFGSFIGKQSVLSAF